MTNNQLTREKVQYLHDAAEEAAAVGIKLTMNPNELLMFTSALLAAMDSEPEELPLDYLQGHRDGLEWAAQLAKANHPETGDWLYDDPIELAKAISKGPDMPPAMQAVDSEPDRNPVLAYADSYRDMAKQGVESVPIWSVITDLERNIAPLYRHAQQPVVPDYPETLPCPVLLEPGMRFGKGVKTRLVLDAIQRRARHYAELEAMTPEERAEYDANIEAFKAMLPQPAPVVPDERAAFNAWNNDIDCPLAGRDAKSAAWMAWQARAKLAGNSPVIPGGLIAAVNRLLDSDGSRGCYSAIRCHDAREEVERLLAAAPQEVNHG